MIAVVDDALQSAASPRMNVCRTDSKQCHVVRVHTDPGKSWNFIVQNSRPWKVLEKGIGPGKSWRVLEL